MMHVYIVGSCNAYIYIYTDNHALYTCCLQRWVHYSKVVPWALCTIKKDFILKVNWLMLPCPVYKQ